MKHKIEYLLIAFCLMSVSFSCEKEEDPFVCDSNTVLTDDDVKKCGVSRVTGYSATATTEEFRMQVEGGYEVRLMNLEGLLEENKPYTPFELYFTGLNKHLTNTITITDIDRANKKLSFTYSFENEREYNSQAFYRKTVGTVTGIGF